MRALLLALLLLLPNTARAEPVAPIADPSSDPPLLRLVQDELTSSGLATFGVAVLHLPSGRTALVNPDLVFEAASLYKLMVMYEVYQQIDRGQLALSERLMLTDAHFDPELGDSELVPGQELTVDDALESIITVSETAPALALLDRISYRDLAPDLRLLGLEATRIDAGVATSPRDMLRYFQIMAQLGAVGPEASQQMLGRLTRQRVRDRIGRQLPPGTLVAHKTGNLPGVVHDAGIIYTSAGPTVLAMLAQDVALADDAAVRAAMARLAGEVARYALDGGFAESAAAAPLWDPALAARLRAVLPAEATSGVLVQHLVTGQTAIVEGRASTSALFALAAQARTGAADGAMPRATLAGIPPAARGSFRAWHDADGRREAAHVRLASGEYVLAVVAPADAEVDLAPLGAAVHAYLSHCAWGSGYQPSRCGA